MRIAGIHDDSIVDGPGLRYAVFTQGCPRHCEGCHNPETQDPSGGTEIAPESLAEMVARAAESDPLLAGVTFSGGEPMEQAGALIPAARAARERGLSVWVYTGLTIEEIARSAVPEKLELVRLADVLVDGPFEQSRRTLDIPFIGSSNQRIIRNPAAKLDGLLSGAGV